MREVAVAVDLSVGVEHTEVGEQADERRPLLGCAGVLGGLAVGPGCFGIGGEGHAGEARKHQHGSQQESKELFHGAFLLYAIAFLPIDVTCLPI